LRAGIHVFGQDIFGAVEIKGFVQDAVQIGNTVVGFYLEYLWKLISGQQTMTKDRPFPGLPVFCLQCCTAPFWDGCLPLNNYQHNTAPVSGCSTPANMEHAMSLNDNKTYYVDNIQG